MTLNAANLDFLKNIDQKGKVIATYIWIDGAMGLRAKNRTLESKVTSVDQLPGWNFDGSSCYQATTENSEIIMKPVAYYPDPFLGGDNILVLCECVDPKLQPIPTNTRNKANALFNMGLSTEPWFGRRLLLLGQGSQDAELLILRGEPGPKALFQGKVLFDLQGQFVFELLELVRGGLALQPAGVDVPQAPL